MDSRTSRRPFVRGWRICLTTAAILWLLTASCMPLLAAEPTPALRRIRQPGPLIIAHRGASLQAPENTLPAFRLALAARADLVELDYLLTSDGVPVVFHDSTLDRTTDARQRWGGKDIAAASKTAADLAALDAGTWFGRVFATTRIPTLVEALETIQPTGCALIERKTGKAADLVSLLEARGWLDQVVVQSFNWQFIRDAHRLAPSLVLGALGPPSRRGGRELTRDEKVLSPAFVDEVAGLGAQVVGWDNQVTSEAVAYAHQRGLRVWTYTIDDPQVAAHLVRLGVDGIITDDPAALRARLFPQADERAAAVPNRAIPVPLPDHPGHIHHHGETVQIRLPERLSAETREWRLLDERHQLLRRGELPAAPSPLPASLAFEGLELGWYRLEFGPAGQSNVAWTTAAVLKRLGAPVPADSPVCLDSATAWFARNDVRHQERLANLAALAGVNWVRDRLRWADLEPEPGALASAETTYDTAARLQHAAGLKVLQVFHDTPRWARSNESGGGQFAPDLRHVYRLAQALAHRFQGKVAAWEPWNEANIAVFGGHTVDQMCAWQKAAWLGFKAGDPDVLVGWNVTAAVPTPSHTEGVLANETWPYYDTYNIHTYDGAHGYADLWKPARDATAGRPLWITEADRGTPHLKNPPWYDQDPRLERLKAEWIAQSYASSIFAGARRHFHFILGHYHEPSGVQFGLLRLDLTPRPAYVALATVGRCLAGARVLGRWRPLPDLHLYAFRAWPDGVERDVLVVWAEKDADWDGRGTTTVSWALPKHLEVHAVTDAYGRPHNRELPSPIGSAPHFVFLPPGQAVTLPLEAPPALAPLQSGQPSPVVLQMALPRAAHVRVEDLPWSEGHAYAARVGESLDFTLHAYNFGSTPAKGRVSIVRQPAGWETTVDSPEFEIAPMQRASSTGTLRIARDTEVRDGWVVLRAGHGGPADPALAFRIVARGQP